MSSESHGESEVERTAAVTVEIFPSGTPGKVIFNVVDDGPVLLNRSEMVYILRAAADRLASTPPEGDSDS